jgi:Cu2+-containing amine oxidase
MTSQTKAGWYRYLMKWTFHLDGRLEPFFGFSAVTDNCVNYAHRHHAYWRLDFDIDGPAGDVVTEGPDPPLPPKRGRRPPILVLPAESMRLHGDPELTWSVIDSQTRRGYRIVPGSETELPADTFSVGDLWLLNYRSTEIDDSGQNGPACAIKIGNFLDGESLAGDVVVWYRTGAFHDSGHLDECHTVGPMLEPIGDWSP